MHEVKVPLSLQHAVMKVRHSLPTNPSLKDCVPCLHTSKTYTG